MKASFECSHQAYVPYLTDSPLSSTRTILSKVFYSTQMMRQLLESDDMVIPDEDAVLEFLCSWLAKDKEARAKYANEFKQLIRYPYLSVSSKKSR